MDYQVISPNEWVYPDSPIDGPKTAKLACAKGADICFQVLTDASVSGGESLSVTAQGLDCDVVVYQMLPACVNLNSHAVLGTTTDYASVADFVTREAPFYVYDITYLPEDGQLKPGRAAFYIRLNIAANAAPGIRSGSVRLAIDDKAICIPVELRIYNVQVPALEDSRFRMVNWIYYNSIPDAHNVALRSEDYFRILEKYLENQLDMRNDVLMIPSGVPVRDADGKIIDFDFTHAEEVGNLALKMGFRSIMGGFIARWKNWDNDEIYLLWDREVGVTTTEGYRQTKLYFTKAQECVQRNNWHEFYMQCMVDEPQIPNALAYRALSSICRQSMPGVKINDPIEAVDLAGSLDVWVVKQAFYEKHLDAYRQLQDLGEEFWVYTCGFPSGKTMNRVMDLPLNAGRLPMWLCIKYGFTGFLHWGYHCHTEKFEEDTCMPNRNCGFMPAGNGFVVYPGKNGPEYGVRGHLQRAGAIDYELLIQLMDKSPEKALALVETMCRSFDDYEVSGTKMDEAYETLLALLEE